MKNYEVELFAKVVVVVVGAENEEKASDYAMDECLGLSRHVYETSISELTDGELEEAKRHADYVAEDS